MKRNQKFKGMSVLQKVRLIWRLLMLSRNPSNYKNIERLRLTLVKSGYFNFLNESFFQDIDWRQVEKDNQFLKRIDLSTSAQNEVEDNLSVQFRKFLETHSLSKNYFSYRSIDGSSREITYTLRVLMTHDLWHILYGYDTTEEHEIAMQMFLYRQLKWPSAPFLIGGYIIVTAFKDPTQLRSLLELISKAWKHAGESPILFDCSFQNFFVRNLSDIRRQYGIKTLEEVVL